MNMDIQKAKGNQMAASVLGYEKIYLPYILFHRRLTFNPQ